MKAGAISGSLVPVPLLGSEITEKEGASPEKNPLACVAAPVEAITAGVVAVDVPNEKAASVTEEASYFFSSAPLSLETKPVSPLMIEGEDEPKENQLISPDFGCANNLAPK